jgi:hypothetical protein
MATKNNPGAFDCYSAARGDEPIFVLLGRDECAAQTVRDWCKRRVWSGRNAWDDPQITEAMQCADAMATYHVGCKRGS